MISYNSGVFFLGFVVALIRAVWIIGDCGHLLGCSVLGDSFGALADGVLCQFSGEKEAHCGLHFTAADGRLLVVLTETGSFGGDAFENVVDEAVHDGHGATRNSSIWVDLLQNLVDVDAVALLPLPTPLLVGIGPGSLGSFLGTLLGNLSGWRSHCER